MKKTRIWIQVGGNASNIKAGNPFGWRCFPREKFEVLEEEEIPLKHWKIVGGEANEKNYIPGTKPAEEMTSTAKLVAWIDIFGDVVIENDVLEITLRNP